MAAKVAVVYWCQGAGHAARNIAIAKELKSRGHDVVLDGGGPGQMFAEMNGFGEPGYEFETIPVIDKSPLSIVKRGVLEVVPAAVKRFRSVYGFLKEEDPDVVITDGHVTIFTATLMGKELYTLNHLRPEFFGGIGRVAAEFFDWFSLLQGEEIFFTCLWPDEDTGGEDVVPVNPLAQEGDGDVDPYDVLLIPGSFGRDFERLRGRLEGEDLEVRTVGDEDWETKEAMTPYTEAADCVVCTGFSSIADSVVAGTPCVVFPHLHMQELLAEEIDERGVEGVTTAYSVEGAFRETLKVCEGGSEEPEFENGAEEIVDRVLGVE